MPKFFGPGALLDPSSAHSAFSQGRWEQLDFSSLVIRCEIWHCFPVFPIFEANIYSICGKCSHTFPVFPPHLSPVWAWSKICKVRSRSKTVPSAAAINLKSWLFHAALLHFTWIQHKKWLFDKIEGGMLFPPDCLIIIIIVYSKGRCRDLTSRESRNRGQSCGWPRPEENPRVRGRPCAKSSTWS